MAGMELHVGLARALRWLRQGPGQILFPWCCVGCGMPLADERLPLCEPCLIEIERPGMTEVAAQLHRLPVQVFEHAFALWIFEKKGPVQHLQHRLKYGNRPLYGLVLGQLMASEYLALFPPPDCLIPVPLHPLRRIERGYNQSAWLARGFSGLTGIPVEEQGLCRQRSTSTQTSLHKSERWYNVKGAFHTPLPALVSGKRCLLVDDVLTTGATATAAATALSEAGAARVDLAVFAFARI